MARLIDYPTAIDGAGTMPIAIEEFVGRVNSGTSQASVARLRSPAGWEEPGQTPEFDEYTVVIAGILRVTSRDGTFDVAAGQAVIAPKGEWVRYGSPHEGGADYIAVCVPAFSLEAAHRDAS
jgi:mannose-6-phosphate isomerase-like protein (cupin superfamily)